MQPVIKKNFVKMASFQWRHVSVLASQITANSIVCSTTCPSWHQSKHQSPVSLAFCEVLYEIITYVFEMTILDYNTRVDSRETVSIVWQATGSSKRMLSVGEIRLRNWHRRDDKISHIGIKSTFHLLISPLSFLIARQRQSNSILTDNWQLSNLKKWMGLLTL